MAAAEERSRETSSIQSSVLGLPLRLQSRSRSLRARAWAPEAPWHLGPHRPAEGAAASAGSPVCERCAGRRLYNYELLRCITKSALKGPRELAL